MSRIKDPNWNCRELSCSTERPHEGHEHWCDHLTVIVKGPVRVDWKDPDGSSGSEVLDRGDFLLIPAPRFHTFTALHERGAEWRCIFKYDAADGVARENFDKDK